MRRRSFLSAVTALSAGTFTAASTTLTAPAALAATSSLVRVQNGKLVYTPFANNGETAEDNVIPDFSHAGYRAGQALPSRSSIPVRETLSPADSGDDTSRIQAAIDRVSQRSPDAAGFRGAVLLRQGRYRIGSTVKIMTGGVVLRGEGQDVTGGTILEATGTSQYDALAVGTDPAESSSTGAPIVEDESSRTEITSSFVGSGRRSFTVDSISGYTVGDRIVVVRTPNDHWIDELDMAQHGWKSADYAVYSERRITSISGSTVTIDIPLVQAITAEDGGGHIAKYTMPGRISNVGVEDLHFLSSFASATDEQHGWNAVTLEGLQNSWVRNITARYFGYSTVNILGTVRQVTVQDCAYLDGRSQVTGGRRYAFAINGTSTCNLFQRLYSRAGRHDFVTGSKVPGPNVFLDCVAVDSTSDTGPHHRYATGVLFDGVTTNFQLNVQNRKASGTGHGWAGAQTLFWNSQAGSSHLVESPPGARNWSIGCSASSRSGNGTFESFGTAVTPRSLYLQQLQDRLGTSGRDAVTVPAQRSGSITSLLTDWAGEDGPLAG